MSFIAIHFGASRGRQILLRCALYTALVAGLVSTAGATKVKPLSLPEITSSAERVIHCVVTETRSARDEETQLICTWTTVKIAEVLKGDIEEPEITFKQLGGIDREREVIAHTYRARFTPGEEVVLFLYPESKIGFSSPVGINQGVFNVLVNPKTKEKQLKNGMPSHILFSDRPYPIQDRLQAKSKRYDTKTLKTLEQCKSMELEDFKDGVKSLLTLQKEQAKTKQ